ncbi:MAG: EAL domain-containing protein, partial [Thiogranum sp.]|nr:EAL domain-containing protein [Thiogranum sp.]
PLSMAVNLSSRQFHEAELADRLIESLERHALPASSIELEITETTLLQYLPATAATLHKLSARGFSIALDDFGTGYSSLSYLRRFPIDTVKIDRSFVRDIPDDANDVAITRAIVVMAQSLQLRLIAEGVETTQQCEFLRGLGCNAMQGYLFSKPLDADAMSLYLEETHRSIEVSDRQA